MAIPINIEDLLNKSKIEPHHIKFNNGWNPDRIYRTICAFANDFDNICGGYIVVGVEGEKRIGAAKRPITNLPIEGVENSQRDMIWYNNKNESHYMTHIDGKSVLVIWVSTGLNRPYNVRECVTVKQAIGDDFFEPLSDTISEQEAALIAEMAKQSGAKKSELAEKLSLSIRTLSRRLQNLSYDSLELIGCRCSKKTSGYMLAEKGKAFVKSKEE